MLTVNERKNLREFNDMAEYKRRRLMEDNRTKHQPRPLPFWFGIVHENRDVMAVFVVCCIGFVLWMVW